MPDNSSRGHRSLGAADVAKAALLAVLLLTPLLVGISVLGVSFAQTKYSAWLKLVTDSWDGTKVPGYVTPVLPEGPGFPDRYNVTNACVEVYRLKGVGGADFAGSFYPNGTGFVRVEWPKGWENVTIVVKAKSYQGECIGTAGNPYSGIIIYWLTVNPVEKFRTQFGINVGNTTIGDDGIEEDMTTGGYFPWDGDAPFNAGPIDVVTPKKASTWGADFQADHNDPRNAWVAHTAYIFKLFHEHTWYSVNDVLTYAIITIHDVDHTGAGDSKSLLQAAITGSDGQSRYTREIYPKSAGVGDGKFADNKLVPIPLQVINLGLKKPFEGGIPDPEEADGFIEAPHLNVTKRVWWETVLTNQTFYVGKEYNGTAGEEFEEADVDDKFRPLFGAYPSIQDPADPLFSPAVTQGGIKGVPAGPLSLALNHTVPLAADGFQVSGSEWDYEGEELEGVANFNNNTVFYARFCVQDADLRIQHPEVGDKMVGAEVTVNLKTVGKSPPYYLSHNILTTDAGGCTNTPHKWPGYLDQFRSFARFPNGTNWGLRGSLNVSKHFDPKDDRSPAWSPGGYFERAWGGRWDGPWVNAGKNWSALIPDITYMKTRQLTDDLNYDGFDVQVKWKGGSRNGYGGTAVLVESLRVKNPYAIAALYNYEDEEIFGGWVFPYTELANNKLWLQIHSASSVAIAGDDIEDPIPTLLEIMGPFTLTLSDFDSATGTFDVTITADGPLVVNNASDSEEAVDWSLVEDQTIVVEDALVSLKKHDIFDALYVWFDGVQGQVDVGADGRDDYTTVYSTLVRGGPLEVELWPGPPGTGTIRVLISGHNIDYIINDPLGPTVTDYTGALLLKGPPLQGPVFFSLEELEELAISGEAPEEGNLVIDGDEYTAYSLLLNGGILSVGPITGAVIDDAFFDSEHTILLSSLFEDMMVEGTAIDTTITYDDTTTTDVFGEADFSIELTDYPTIDITSFVVPLTDLSADNEDFDDYLFGGYDDFALTGTGLVYITAWVHDLAWKAVDNMGNTLPASNTEVTLLRTNGDPVTRGAFPAPDQFQGNLEWSYNQWAGADTGYAIFYQLPGDMPYDVIVKFDGTVVYDEPGWDIEKLVKTEIIEIVVDVYKLKLVIVDCQGASLDSAYFRYIDQRGITRIDRIDPHGAKDFGYVPGGTIRILGVWWKGVWVPFLKATLGKDALTLNPDGSLTLEINRNYDIPVKLYANILDITFVTWDLNKDNRIPRLNVTLTWVGEHPLTARKLWFLQTLDPTGDTNDDPFNTTKRVDQFFEYTVEYRQSKPEEAGELKSYAKVEYIFYQMPPTFYNITVTTVIDERYAGTDPEDWRTPGGSKWPGRDVPVPYEIKIKYTSTNSPPVEVLGDNIEENPDGYDVDDRVVLRIFSTFNPGAEKFGTPVTDTWPFAGAKRLLNPEGVGDFSTVKACNATRDLLTWAQTFYKRLVDGDRARRIGDATYEIFNDNDIRMEFYNPKTGLFEPEHEAFWTEDTVDTTWLKSYSQFSSVVWWNGSYRAQGLSLPTNMSFTVDKFWNGSDDLEPTYVWPRHNFTVQPSREHFLKMHAWYVGNWTDINATVAPYGTAIVFEKDTLRLPAPVTFVKPQAIDKGGAPLEKALIEAWILDLDTASSVEIDGADTGGGWLTGTVSLEWEWEKKWLADPDEPQKFNLERWDRVNLTFRSFEPLDGSGVTLDTIIDVILNFTAGPRETRIMVPGFPEYVIIIHLVAGTAPSTATFTVELKSDGDLLDVETETITDEGDIVVSGTGASCTLSFANVRSDPPRGVAFDLSGTCSVTRVTDRVVDTKTIFVQVPPYPAKLYLRNVIGGLDVVVTAKEVTALVDDEDDTPDGLLKYEQWKTLASGLIKSFTLPDYAGLLMLPTSGWLADEYADDPDEEEFHYQFNVVWKSAVVYSDNLVLEKKEVVFGASEVYDVRFMFTLSNSTSPTDAVRNLNLWIYYPNVTTWHTDKLWGKVPAKPQDYKACKDSAFGCGLRVTLISAADADGIVEFAKIPGPRFMNTTWKYVFTANHSAITWLKDLVATQFVLNNETFGDGPLKVVTRSRVDVPIMLNAAHQLYFLVLGWRDEQGIATAYPLEGFTVKYEIRRKDAGLTVASGTAVSGANGVGEVRSDPADPRKVLWAGLTVRYRVEPPSWMVNVNDPKWKELLGARNVQIVEYGAYSPDARPSIGAYYPDEVPTHWAIKEIRTWWDEEGYCYGLCTAFIDGRQQSKPFVINVDYTIVTVRALDFNGRPLRGAFVEIIERASGRVAGWSYTFGQTWTRQPIDLITLYHLHRVALLPARIVGGDGYTEFMPVAVGPWNYDANNDDRIDASGYRGDDPRTATAEGTALQYIVRTYWAATDATPDNANGDLRAIWPFIDPQKPFSTTEAGQSVRKYHVKVYDSDFDETDELAKTLVVPIDSMVEIRKPSEWIYKYDGKHRDVTTAVFDFKLLLNYEGKTLPDDIKTKLEVQFFKKTGAVTELALKFRGGPAIDTVTVNRLPRGVYEVRVIYTPTGATIFTRTFDISIVNVGTVQAEASLPFTDLSFEVTDLRGRPLPIAEAQVTVEPRELYSRVTVAGNVVTIESLYTGAPVTVSVAYASPVYGTSADARITDSAEGFKTRLLGGRTLQLPVDDVTVTVVDRQGRPMGGAVVKLGAAPAKSTGGDGKAVFERVPLESAGRGITYSLSVTVGGVEVTPADARSVELSTARTSITVVGELFSLPVRVIGQLGQGLAGANVRVVKGAVTVASASTDEGGFAQFDRLVLDTYTVVANYKGYSQEVSVTSADLQAGRVVEITLPIYTELLGIPMPLSTLLALIIGLILLVVVLAIIVSEYRWWRGRRLGVYPPAPPKAPK
ncbi:MAG: carboxypeptidase-like regulatory domain-containing protein [Nitrososphaerota archaeon]|nr:carboxypeptidase-like regulatory domain-containing protein [Nitrososphaerota archaeon]